MPFADASTERMLWAVVGLVVLVGLWMAARAWTRQAARRSDALRARLHDGSLSPRNHHYMFVHAALKELALADPDKLVIALSAPESDRFLLDLWYAVGRDIKRLAQSGSMDEVEEVSAEGLEAIPARVAHHPAVLVRMPEPRATTEAHFAAIVLNHDIDEPPKPAPEPPVYFFTLEKGFTLDASPRTVFCEWDATAHKNYGDGPPADPRSFLDWIDRHLTATKSKSPEASYHPKADSGEGSGPDAS